MNCFTVQLLRISLALLLFFMMSVSQWSFAAEINGVRLWRAPDKTRLVFDMSEGVQHKLFTLSSPDRVVIDLTNTKPTEKLNKIDLKDSLISGIRNGVKNKTDLRVVLDLDHKVNPKSFILKPNKKYGHRLVVDLESKSKKVVKTVRRDEEKGFGTREVIVAIDAGHGGEDPGATGPKGVKEKDVVYQIAQRLYRLLEKEPGIRPVLTREGDYYVKLKRRRQIARDIYHADLLVSLHADAWTDYRAKGASVYILSRSGATSTRARYLAEKENAADLIGGVELDDKDDVLKSVLVDLALEGSMEHSLDVGNFVLKELGRVAKIHKSNVEQAGFVVLKSPDIPGILIELGFISNPREEKAFTTAEYQNKLAKAIRTGVKKYFVRQPPPDTYFANLRNGDPIRHRIARGETISEIALRYRISPKRLKKFNAINSDVIRVGQVLRIPNS